MPTRLRGRAEAVLRRIALRARVGRPWARVTDVLSRHGRGELSGATALSHLLQIYRDVDVLRKVLERSKGASFAAGASDLSNLLESHRPEVAQALASLIVEDDATPAHSLEAGLQRYRRRFDAAVQSNPAASVALHSLGDERLLTATTEEAASLMVGLGVAAPDRHLLDLGCGIGRFEAALSPKVASITGIDVAPAMVAAARKRCAGLANVRLLETSGSDLGAFTDRSFDSVIAVDIFPYLYEVGGADFVFRQLAEVARVLKPQGDLLVFELSYRGDPELDKADARRFAERLGFELLRNGTLDLVSWDGRTFHLHRSASTAISSAQLGSAKALS